MTVYSLPIEPFRIASSDCHSPFFQFSPGASISLQPHDALDDPVLHASSAFLRISYPFESSMTYSLSTSGMPLTKRMIIAAVRKSYLHMFSAQRAMAVILEYGCAMTKAPSFYPLSSLYVMSVTVQRNLIEPQVEGYPHPISSSTIPI